jgi:hypothetical protein
MNNLYEYGEFKDKKTTSINESAAQLFDDEGVWKIRHRLNIPISLINSYVKKVQQEIGKDIRKTYSEQELAEYIADYVSTAFLTIENLPVSIVSNAQQEPKLQTQGENDSEMPPQAQPVQETPAQPVQETPAQSTQTQPVQEPTAPAQTPAQGAQGVAQKIPQTESNI